MKCKITIEFKPQGFNEITVRFPTTPCHDLLNVGMVLSSTSSDYQKINHAQSFSTQFDTITIDNPPPWAKYIFKAFVYCGSKIMGYIRQDIYTGPASGESAITE